MTDQDQIWVVLRSVPTAQNRDVRVGAELFATEAAAKRWAKIHPHEPGERRACQLKTVIEVYEHLSMTSAA